MPTLLLINGPPAAGKSTVARRLAQRRPNSRVVDLDVLRTNTAGWQDDPRPANLVAQAQGLTIVAAALADGRDVVVPQLLARPEYPAQLRSCALDAGARWCEVHLAVDAEVTLDRFVARSTHGEHAYAAWQVEREGGPESLRQWTDRLDAYRSDLLDAGLGYTVIDTTQLSPEDVVTSVLGGFDG